jgi:hypothetical protein
MDCIALVSCLAYFNAIQILCKLIIVDKCIFNNFWLYYFVVMADESKHPDECRALVARPPVINVDASSHFVTNRVFVSKEEVVKWAREVSTPLRFIVVVVRSDNGGGGRKLFIVLGCERGGKYKPT